MCSQIAFTKGALGILEDRSMKLDFNGKLPEELFIVFLHVQIQALLMFLVFTSAGGVGNILLVVC